MIKTISKEFTTFEITKMKIQYPDLTILESVQMYFILGIKNQFRKLQMSQEFTIVEFTFVKSEEFKYTFDMKIEF
jgi:hypothetical protein